MSEHYYCKYCGKEIIGPNRKRKKFCNHSCAASFNNMGRKHTDEEKLKISHSLQERNPNFNGVYKEIEPNQKRNYEHFEKYKEYFCIACGKKIDNPYASKTNKFCSSDCRKKYLYEEYIEKWKRGEKSGLRGKYLTSATIRKYLFEKYNNSCQICGWNKVNEYTGNVPLQVHHIDGDCTNNKEENLQLLCPNCHSLTENFGRRNKNATKGRSKYFGKA